MGETRRSWIARYLGSARAEEFEVEPGPLAWLVDLWSDAGQARVEFGMAGVVLLGLGWSELAAWTEGAGEHDLAPVFRRGILALSAAYANEAMAAREIESEAPFDPGKR